MYSKVVGNPYQLSKLLRSSSLWSTGWIKMYEVRFSALKYTSANGTFTLYCKPYSLPTFRILCQMCSHSELGLWMVVDPHSRGHPANQVHLPLFLKSKVDSLLTESCKNAVSCGWILDAAARRYSYFVQLLHCKCFGKYKESIKASILLKNIGNGGWVSAIK